MSLDPEDLSQLRRVKRSASLGFEGGGLIVNLEGYEDFGSGHFAFSQDDLEPVTEYDDETDARWDGWLAKLPSSELAGIRDFLNEWLPPAALQAAEARADGVEAENKKLRELVELTSAIAPLQAELDDCLDEERRPLERELSSIMRRIKKLRSALSPPEGVDRAEEGKGSSGNDLGRGSTGAVETPRQPAEGQP